MHSRIYQISEKPITEFTDEYRYEEDFVGNHADYVVGVEYDSEDYMADLKWLRNVTEGLEVNLKEKPITVINKKQYFSEKHDKFQELLEKLQNITLEEFSSRARYFDILDLKSAFDDEYSFYVDDNDEFCGITTLDNWVRNAEEGKKYYVGSIFDYHF